MRIVKKTYGLFGAMAAVLAFGFAAPAMADDAASKSAAVAACDAIAAHPDDPDRVGAPHVKSEIDLPVGIDICRKASEAAPDNQRVRYQYARLLSYSGNRTDSLKAMKIAADADYRQAQFVYGVFVNYQRDGAPADLCIAEQYWKKSAEKGRQAARVNYVKERLRDRFRGCGNMATPDEMAAWLKTAAAESKNYYETLFIKDLADRLVLKSTGQSRAEKQGAEPAW